MWNRRTQFALRIALYLLGFCHLTACARRAAVVVTVPTVPSEAATLSVLVSAGEQGALENPQFDVSAHTGGGSFLYSFGVHPPTGTMGPLGVGIGAYDRKGCLLTTGHGVIELDDSQNDFALNIDLEPMPSEYSAACRSGSLIVRSLQQKEDAPQRAVIRGWGFVPGTTVSIDGIPLSEISRPDHTQIEATLPLSPTLTPSPSGVRRVTLDVHTPDGMTVTLMVPIYTLTFSASSYGLDQNREMSSVGMADLDGDGKVDLVVGGSNNPDKGFIALYRNQGGGKFPQMPQIIELDGVVDSVLVADLNTDGRPDIAASMSNLDKVYVFYNQGQGVFSINPGLSILNAPVGSGPGPLGIGNFVADGNPDLLVGTRAAAASGVFIHANNGATGIAANSSVMLNLNNAALSDFVVHDLNVDGRLDLAVLFFHGGASSTIVSEVQPLPFSGGTFDFTQPSQIAAGSIGQIRAADFDGSGRPDLFVSGALTPTMTESSTTSLFLGQGGAGTTYATRNNVKTAPSPFGLGVADFNRDTRPDVVVTSVGLESSGTVAILLNHGSAPHFPTPDVPTLPVGISDTNLAIGDLNSDGKPDLVVVSRGSSKANQPPLCSVFLNTSL